MQRTRIILATHGYFADGILSSAKIIIGDIDNVETLCCYTEEHVNYEDKIYELLEMHDYDSANLLVITDLLGGSINNIFMNHIKEFPFLLVSGLNLALLLECLMHPQIEKEALHHMIQRSAESITLCNEHLQQNGPEEDF